MDRRLSLHKKLLELAPRAYYQPPSNDRMAYPCFRYNLSNLKIHHANNNIYTNDKAYLVTYISLLPEDTIIDQMLEKFQYCRFDRHYIGDDLHHYVFVVFY